MEALICNIGMYLGFFLSFLIALGPTVPLVCFFLSAVNCYIRNKPFAWLPITYRLQPWKIVADDICKGDETRDWRGLLDDMAKDAGFNMKTIGFILDLLLVTFVVCVCTIMISIIGAIIIIAVLFLAFILLRALWWLIALGAIAYLVIRFIRYARSVKIFLEETVPNLHYHDADGTAHSITVILPWRRQS